LRQNYPNPFNPSTTITFDIPRTGFTSIVVYNMLGQKVTTLVASVLSPGTYSAQWDARDAVPTGVYLVRMRVTGSAQADFSAVRKIMFVK
jgi:hypothetical protein